MSREFETISPDICCSIQFCIFIYLFPIGYYKVHLRMRRYKLINEHISMHHIFGQLLYICLFFASRGLQQQGRFEMLN